MVTVIPAIDVLGGRCVRLERGDPARPTVDLADPVAVALNYAHAGARRLHIVNLGAALGRDEGATGLSVLQAVASSCDVPVQYGGGLRSLAALEEALAAGASWVITGTSALEQPGFLAEAVRRFGERVILALDLRDGRPLVRGWQSAAAVDLPGLMATWLAAGLRTLMVTDADADGTLGGSRLAAFEPLLGRGLSIIAAGGVAGLSDIRALASHGSGRGLTGIVVGSALLQGKFTFAEAELAARDGSRPEQAAR